MSIRNVLIVLFGAVAAASAMCPPCGTDPDQIRIVDPQRVYVFHRAGWEDLVLETSYQGKAEDFGMILPVPSVPDVRMVQHAFFDAVTRAAGQFDQFAAPRDAGMLAEQSKQSDWREHVQVVRKQAAGVFNSVTLKADRLDALQNWLDENHYKYADDEFARKVFQAYIDQKWLFLAVQVRVEETGGQFDGRFRPMGVRFRTKDIVIPTRVASIYPQGMPFEIYVMTNRAVDFPKSWGAWRNLAVSLSADKLLAEADLMRELAGEAFFSATDDLTKMAEKMKGERKDEYGQLLRRKLSGLYLSVFTGMFSREQLSTSDLVFEGQDLLSAADVEKCLEAFGSGELDKVKDARRTLEMVGSGHVETLVAHLANAKGQLRIAIAQILGGLGEPSAVPGLLDALAQEEDPLGKMALQTALRDITGVTSSMDDKAWREWWERWNAAK